MVKQIERTIEIDAPAERVWQILTDFAAYPAWNPFLKRIEGAPVAGSRLVTRIHPPGSRALTFRPTVVAVEPNRELRWLGRLWVPGVFDGEHSFTITPHGPDRVRFVQRERFTGILVPIFASTLMSTEEGFGQFNEALKRRAEGGSASGVGRLTGSGVSDEALPAPEVR